MGYFETAAPEKAGISARCIEAFLNAADQTGLELHRFMILRHGKCCARAVWAPYGENDLHPLYSFSKSITATAVGFARQEGLLSLDEHIADLFPEDLPSQPSENLKKCTIHHLLCMSCGHETESEDWGPDWRKSFFAHPFLHEPGTFYKYNTVGTNILAAVIRKKTGLQVTEYLRPRLFEPLGIGEVPCYQLPDDLETQAGGAGMKMAFDDMARFTQFMLQNGVWEGRTLLGGWYHALAGTRQIETAGDSEGHIKDWARGYGYQCWMCYPEGSFRADGAYGQFGLVYPSLDMCIIINAATEQTQTMIDAVNEYILPGVLDQKPLPIKESSLAFTESKTALPGGILRDIETGTPLSLSLPVLQSCRNPLFENVLERSVYASDDEEQMCAFRSLVGGAGLFGTDCKSHISRLRFSFEKDSVILYFTEGGKENPLKASLSHSWSYTLIDGIRYAACARWRSLRKLELEIRRTDAISGVRLILKFKDGRLYLEADETLMTDGDLGMTGRRLTKFHLAG